MRSPPVNEPEQFAVAYWLLPAAPFQKFFRETIQRLAAKYDAPVFEPHLTLAVGADSPDEAEEKLAQLPQGQIELRARAVTWTSKFTKTLFVRFDSSPRLLQLRISLSGNEVDFDPHLSLLYKRIPEKEQERLAAGIHLSFASVTFDTVVATRCRLPVETAADVAVWKSVAARRLISKQAG